MGSDWWPFEVTSRLVYVSVQTSSGVLVTRGHGAVQATQHCRVKPDGPTPVGGTFGHGNRAQVRLIQGS